MARYGFEMSERLRIPVLLRMVTRLAHSRAVVEVGDVLPENELHYPENPRQWVLMPGNSRVRNRQLIAEQDVMVEESENSPFNTLTLGTDRRLGIVVSGIASNYLNECFPDGCPFSVLKVSQYPLPKRKLRQLADNSEALMVIEEGQPVIEEMLRGILDCGMKIYGKLDYELPRDGELTPDSVAQALSPFVTDIAVSTAGLNDHSKLVVPRPPALCQGCGHRDVYHALNDAMKQFDSPKVFGDIGCYTLGWLAPFNAIDTVVDMGASITMAKGAADAGQHPSIAIIGDSTFTHSGMTGLLDAVNENSNITIVISDNLTTGMTGGQDSQGTGKIEQICLGIGVDPAHLHTIDSLPKNHEEMTRLFVDEINYKGLSVIVSRRECIQTARRHAKKS